MTKEQKIKAFRNFLKYSGACSPARRFCRGLTVEEAYQRARKDKENRGTWFEWLRTAAWRVSPKQRGIGTGCSCQGCDPTGQWRKHGKLPGWVIRAVEQQRYLKM